jgi:hypothetical protein
LCAVFPKRRENKDWLEVDPRAEDRVEVKIDEIINQYGSWGEKINVREAILEYGANSGFYQVDGDSIVLTELGKGECQRIDIAAE